MTVETWRYEGRVRMEIKENRHRIDERLQKITARHLRNIKLVQNVRTRAMWFLLGMGATGVVEPPHVIGGMVALTAAPSLYDWKFNSVRKRIRNIEGGVYLRSLARISEEFNVPVKTLEDLIR